MKIKRSFSIVWLIPFFGLVFNLSLFAQSKNNHQRNILSKPIDPWTSSQVITTEKLNNVLSDKKSDKPIVLMVGFDFLYDQGHIPGSIFAGTASNKTGLEKLKSTVKNYKKNQSIVIYCGCCPFNHCPNVRPAFKELKDLGYENVRVLYIPNDFEHNWENKGYSTSK
jgi:thiosulfate/3-mercaptopyruvate sulfurtransferase